jgi:hypothetical protein
VIVYLVSISCSQFLAEAGSSPLQELSVGSMSLAASEA